MEYVDQDNDQARIHDYLMALGKPAVAIFDIGTRGARVIVGPRIVPDIISNHTIKMVGRAPNLGLDVEPDTRQLAEDARSLKFVAEFIAHWKAFLAERGVVEFHVITTAWFRWLANKEEIRSFLRERTGLDIESITQQREAQLTLLSLPVLMERCQNQNEPPNIRDEDIVAMADQGGGSLEISWMRWADRHNSNVDIEMVPFPTLGTVALRRDFFHLQRNLFSRTRPDENKTHVKHQVDRIRRKARDALSSSPELPTTESSRPGRLHLFGVGSGITKVASGGPHAIHNRFVDTKWLDDSLGKSLSELGANTEQVRSIWRGLHAGPGDQTPASQKWFGRKAELDRLLTSVFGIPVYQEMLSQTRSKGIYINGYGLGFGYYFNRYMTGPEPKATGPDDQGPYVFISYCRADKAEVEQELDLLREMKTRLWYDVEASGQFDKQIAHKIQGCSALIVFVSQQSVRSDWVLNEISFAQEKRKRIIPIFLDRASLPGELALRLTRSDQIRRPDLTEDLYRAKIERAIPRKCRISSQGR